MKYLVLARRYRPQLFRDVCGQEAVLTTLKNALRLNRVAHGYLFCGSRGVGKTTLARLFAKALNCEALSADCEPCNQCPSCTEILAGQSLDVIEIDGASNRGIDDIRQLNETVGYAPSHGKYKIYIIDEVHMLTKEAFNALLKTLEEPPERAKFFFATTEPHKVLPTIISRCQRFDLQRLSEEQIEGKLQRIAADQNRAVDAAALPLIASFAEGSLRDAESLFDQILCFAEGRVEASHVQSVLGLVADDFFLSFDQAFAEGRLSAAFEMVEQLFRMGKDLHHFGEQLVTHYRRLTLLKMAPEQVREPLASKLSVNAKLYTLHQLFYILETMLPALSQMQKSQMPRVSLEALLLHILRSKNRIPVEVLVRRLSELEQKLLEAKPTDAPPGETPKQPGEAPKQTERLPELQPVPFNPLKAEPAPPEPKPAPSPVSQLARIEPRPPQQMSLGPPPPLSVEPPRKEVVTPETKPVSSPGRYETLLRFAAVELEGTLKMEK